MRTVSDSALSIPDRREYEINIRQWGHTVQPINTCVRFTIG